MTDGRAYLETALDGGDTDAAEAAGHELWNQRANVLVVEDDETSRELLVGMLNAHGFAATPVDCAEAALRMDHRAHQIVLTDFKLPDLDGLSMLQRLIERDARMIGILMTGFATIDLAIKAMKAGAADVLLKPLEPEQVLLSIKRVLELHRLRRENGLLKQAVLKAPGMRLQSFQLEEMSEGPSAGLRKNDHGDDLSYRRGLADGERRAREREGVAQERQQTVLTSFVQQMKQVGRVPQGLEEQIAALAFQIARKVVRACAEEKRDLVVAQTREALSHVRESSLIKIRVHPSDLPIMETARESLLREMDGPVTVKLEAHPGISPGGCLVETPTRIVDATLESQLMQLGEALKRREMRAAV